MIGVRKLDFGEGGRFVQVIYNPNSGRRIDIRGQLQKKFKERGIPFEIFETQKGMDAFYFIKDKLEISKCLALFLVGGDGTIHESINGMMYREDKEKVPIGLIPNGSGNDTCRGIYRDNSVKAIDSALKGDVIKVDLVKILLDYENEEELDKAIEEGAKEKDGSAL
mmetsp:Transcript_16350/g.27654  ORF Transcript_16350/g.27654 Transcript_16350/m.27654 type:complete len:166 (-) Transcript_16350:671-1168(-)